MNKVDMEARRLNYEYGHVSRSSLVVWMLQRGLDHVDELESQLRNGNGSAG